MQRGTPPEHAAFAVLFERLAVSLAAAVASGDVPAGLPGLARAALGPSQHLRCIPMARATHPMLLCPQTPPPGAGPGTAPYICSASCTILLEKSWWCLKRRAWRAQRVHVQRRRQHVPVDSEPAGRHRRECGRNAWGQRRPRHAGAAAHVALPRRCGDGDGCGLHARADA